jgi:hypothetical protein
MLLWFLILAASTALVVFVAASLYVRIRRQMTKPAAAHKPDADGREDHSSPPEA